MLLVYPLLVAAAAVVVWRSEGARRASWPGLASWCVAGALFTFSLLTGLSIGLFVLPLVVVAMVLATRVAPDFRSALGFPLGAGVVLLAVVVVYV